MYRASNPLESMPTMANRRVLPARIPSSSMPTAVVHPRCSGETGNPHRTPDDAVVLRFFFGHCQLQVDAGAQWHHCGDAGNGMLHVSRPQQQVRSVWTSAGEELLLTVPHDYWRERVTDGMRAALAMGRPCRHHDPVLQQLAGMLMRSVLDDPHASFATPLIDALLARVVALCGAARPLRPRCNALPAFRLRRVAQYVREHLSEPVTLADMAAAAGMSAMHFAAMFRRATGQRPHHYLLEQRILHAKELMTRTSRSLCDIALSAGFSTQAHFSTVFKRYAGTTPKQWRASHAR
jgi:AraC family transcriptional regulator